MAQADMKIQAPRPVDRWSRQPPGHQGTDDLCLAVHLGRAMLIEALSLGTAK
jgi:hypothetical protein